MPEYFVKMSVCYSVEAESEEEALAKARFQASDEDIDDAKWEIEKEE